MITRWEYTNRGELRSYVKQIIKENNYETIDVGGSADYWSYPECKSIIDLSEPPQEDVSFFKINLDSSKQLKRFVKTGKKYDFSICSHTLEDVFNVINLVKFLETISDRGYIAVPSKKDEYSKLYNNPYRGNAHHKQFFDIKNNKLVVYPKYSWSEIDKRSDQIAELNIKEDLILFWEKKIPVKPFSNKIIHNGDSGLINYFYKELLD